jgi:hypothetical protein
MSWPITRSSTEELLTYEQWAECHLRLAELHMGFLDLTPPAMAEQSGERQPSTMRVLKSLFSGGGPVTASVRRIFQS